MPNELPETYTITGVPIFAVGQWNGDVYTEADLDHMVAAFGQVGFQPPMKLGHDKSQTLAKNDGMPAIGWVTNLRRVGTQLYCDIKDLPKKVYEAIKRKNYNRVSAEVYWAYSCNGKRWPRVLKALSLLGADIPAVTSLGALETLYDGEGQGFKRYDMGMLNMPMDSCPQMLTAPAAPLKPKSTVNYREGGEGGLERCGSCKYLQGPPPDPTGANVYIGECRLVDGEVATSWVCDLWEAREAFSTGYSGDFDEQEHPREEDGKFAPKGGGGEKEGGKHPRVEKEIEAIRQQGLRKELSGNSEAGKARITGGRSAKAFDRFRDIMKSAGFHEIASARRTTSGGAEEYLTLEDSKSKARYELTLFIGTGANFAGERGFSIRRLGPNEKPVQGNRHTLIDALSESHSYTIEQRGAKWVLLAKGSGEVLGEHETKADAEAQERAIQATKAKENSQVDDERGSNKIEQNIKVNKSDAAVKERRYMEIEEIDGEFCVMKDGEKMKCFATKEEADAYQVSMMAQSAAEVKALKQKLAASEKLNKDLTDKVSSLEQTTIGLTAKFTELEERTKTAETEASQLKEQSRKAANETWLSEMASEANLKVLPWERPYVAFILDHMTGGQVKTYADNGTDISPSEAFRKLYEQRKAGTELVKELSQGDATRTANEPEKREYASLHEARTVATQKAKAYMKEHPEVKEFSAAFKAVLNEDEGLKAAVSGVTAAGAQKAKEGAERMGRFFKP